MRIRAKLFWHWANYVSQSTAAAGEAVEAEGAGFQNFNRPKALLPGSPARHCSSKHPMDPSELAELAAISFSRV